MENQPSGCDSSVFAQLSSTSYCWSANQKGFAGRRERNKEKSAKDTGFTEHKTGQSLQD
jgi:hypothetical protein